MQVIAHLAPVVHRLSAQHQSDSRQAALADCLTGVDIVISTYPIRNETCSFDFIRYWIPDWIRIATSDIRPSITGGIIKYDTVDCRTQLPVSGITRGEERSAPGDTLQPTRLKLFFLWLNLERTLSVVKSR